MLLEVFRVIIVSQNKQIGLFNFSPSLLNKKQTKIHNTLFEKICFKQIYNNNYYYLTFTHHNNNRKEDITCLYFNI